MGETRGVRSSLYPSHIRVWRGAVVRRPGIGLTNGTARHIIRENTMKQLYKRFWLNKDRGTAFMETSCSVDHGYCEADVKLSDCNRQINLDFGFNKASRKAKIKKLERMISSLQELKDEMEKVEFKR